MATPALTPPRLAQPGPLEMRLDSISHLALAFVFGFVFGSAYYHVPVLNQQAAKLDVVEKKEIPALKKEAAKVPALKKQVVIEHNRAETEKAIVETLASEPASPPTPRPKPPSQ